MSTYFVQRPAKYRRQPFQVGKDKRVMKLSPIWSFDNEVDAIEFAKTFTSCWIEVKHEGKIIYKNYNDKPKWLTMKQAAKVKEHNSQIESIQNNWHTKKVSAV